MPEHKGRWSYRSKSVSTAISDCNGAGLWEKIDVRSINDVNHSSDRFCCTYLCRQDLYSCALSGAQN